MIRQATAETMAMPEFDQSDPDQVEAMELAAKFKAEQELNLVAQTLNTEAGRALAWLLLEEAGVYQVSFTGDAEGTIFRSGRQSLGLKLIELLYRSAPGAFDQMRREAVSRAHYYKTRAEAVVKGT